MRKNLLQMISEIFKANDLRLERFFMRLNIFSLGNTKQRRAQHIILSHIMTWSLLIVGHSRTYLFSIRLLLIFGPLKNLQNSSHLIWCQQFHESCNAATTEKLCMLSLACLYDFGSMRSSFCELSVFLHFHVKKQPCSSKNLGLRKPKR